MIAKADTRRANQTSMVAQTRSRPLYAWYVVMLLTAAAAISYMDRLALVVLAPGIKAELGLNDTQLGFLIGFAFALFYAVCGMPIARYADRSDRRRIVGVALMLWSGMTALSGAAKGFGLLLVARIGVGIGEAGCMPPGNSLICDYIQPSRRPTAFAIYAAGPVIGTFLGLAFVGWLGAQVGWRMAFVLLGIPGFLLGLLILMTLREPARGTFDAPASSAGAQSFWASVRRLLAIKPYRLMVFYACALGFANIGYNSWWPSYFQRFLNVPLAETGAILGVTLAGGQAAGLLLGAWIAARAPGASRARPLRVGGSLILIAVPLTAVALFSTNVALVTACVSLIALLLILPVGTIMTALNESVPPDMRATASALQVLLTSVIGFGTGPTVIGVLSDLVGLRLAMLVPVIVFPVLTWFLWQVARFFGEARSGES